MLPRISPPRLKDLEWGIMQAWLIPYLWMPGGYHSIERGIRGLQKRHGGQRRQYGPKPYREMPSWLTAPASS
ncbi:hypothetical protein LCGC14_0872880 [marine sediment metagenome]|uniref:Uncharacterized protein n=1 Tax=marine sediment metagenome TaxID=412755 RepID=A0A0F9P942_9ZZZZ